MKQSGNAAPSLTVAPPDTATLPLLLAALCAVAAPVVASTVNLWAGLGLGVVAGGAALAGLFNGYRSLRSALPAFAEQAMLAQRKLDQVTAEMNAKAAALEQQANDLSKVNENLQEAQKDLVQAEKMASLGQMVAGIAHEVNTPLGISISMASNIEHLATNMKELMDTNQMKKSDLVKFTDGSKESSTLLLANLKRAADLIQSFKKVAVDQSSEALMDVNVEKTVQDILNTLRPTIRKSGVTIENIGQADLTMFTDPGALFQVFSNFVNNAVLHAFEGIESGRKITIAWRQEGIVVEIRFRDNGRGIPAEHLPKIFDPFFTTKRGKGGSGLGLHIVYNLVTQRLKGQLTCTSTVGEGTEFLMRLPLKVAHRRADGTAIIKDVVV